MAFLTGILDALFGSSGGGAQYTDAIRRSMQGELGLQDMLRAQMMGAGPNLAQQQLQNATQQNIAQTAGAIGSQRGINPGLATRQINQAGAGIRQQMAGQSAEERMREQLASQQMLQAGQLGLLGTTGQLQNQLALQQQRIGAGLLGGGLNAMGGGLGLLAMGGGSSGAPGFAGGGEIQPEHDVVSFLSGRSGGAVPGRARTAGDSRKNDTVPIMASPGEIVLPRSVAQADDAPEKAHAFVQALKRRHMAEGGEVSGEDEGIIEAVKKWWAAPRGQSAEAGRGVAEAIHKKLPEPVSAQKAVESKRARLARLDKETSE